MYNMDKYFGRDIKESKTNIIKEKINILVDFCILKENDKRKVAVKNLLVKCPDENAMSRMLHDVLMGNKTLDELLGGYCHA